MRQYKYIHPENCFYKTVLCKRLKEMNGDFIGIGNLNICNTKSLDEFISQLATKEQSKFKNENNRDEEYDANRILYFANCIKNSIPINPIKIEISSDGTPVVCDGNHRLAAYFLLNKEYVTVKVYGYLNDKTLKYL